MSMELVEHTIRRSGWYELIAISRLSFQRTQELLAQATRERRETASDLSANLPVGYTVESPTAIPVSRQAAS